jgi:hypothetical protein
MIAVSAVVLCVFEFKNNTTEQQGPPIEFQGPPIEIDGPPITRPGNK